MFNKYLNADSPYYRSIRIVLIYIVFSVLWILFSDRALLLFVTNVDTLTSLQTLKGWLFVFVSAWIVFFLLHREIKKLKAVEEKFRAIFDHHFQFTGLLSPEGVLISVNRAALTLVGAKEEDVLGKLFWETAWWSHSVRLQERVKREFSNSLKGKFVRFEVTHPGADGKIHYIDFSFNPVTNEHDEIIYIVPEGRDISPIKEAKENLLFTQHTVDHSSTPILWFGDNRKILYANEAACHLFGYLPSELINAKKHLLHPEATSDYWDKYIPEINKKGSVSGEIELRKKNGTLFTAFLTASYVKYMGQGKIVAHFHDMTKVKEMEGKLRQAQKMEAIGTLAGGIAHDFNNILSIIIGSCDMVLEDVSADSPVRNDIERVLVAGNRARDLVKQILAFSRQGEQEKLPLKVQVVLREALSLLRSSIPSTIKIKQDIDPDCDVVLADPTQIHQVIMNLCTNAYHAMKEKGGELGVSLKSVELTNNKENKTSFSPGKYIQLGISDTGHGINKGDLEKIFDPYFTTKKAGEGTGLGLAVVHGIVASFNGMIDVSSDPDRGTNFHIYLPVIKQAEEIIQKEDDEPLPTGNERILLVDDEEELVEVNKKILERLGYTVTALEDSMESLRMFKEHPNEFDLVITDMTMPNLSGIELAQNIFSVRPEFPIILSTGFGDPPNMEKAKSIGIKNYIMKPIARKDLAKIVRETLDSSS